jgi:hypothetical protein
LRITCPASALPSRAARNDRLWPTDERAAGGIAPAFGRLGWAPDCGTRYHLSADAYASATGVVPLPSLLDLYNLRWDIAVDVSRFRRPHAGSIEDEKTWGFLVSLIERVSGAKR